MISSTELRIGNYVIGPLGEIVKINIIGHHENPDFLHAIGDGFSGQNGFEPIPLTPEILYKIDWAGYVKFHINSYFSIDDVGHFFYHNDYTGINIDYLHQLQNLFYCLCGEELKCNL